MTDFDRRPARKGLVSNIQKFSVDDGPGIRTTVFFKGCNLKCFWCHNPECIGRDPELQFLGNLCTACGKCAKACPAGAIAAPGQIDRGKCTVCGSCVGACNPHALKIVGEWMTAGDILRKAEKDIPYFEESGGGVTLSGGEALLQTDFLLELLIGLKERGIHTAVDTAACLPYEYFEKALPYTDVFLIDIKLFSDELHRKYTAVSNVPILKNIRALGQEQTKIRIRTPLIGGVNATDGEVENIARFVAEIPNVELVELLAYHSYGEGKYESLDLGYQLSGELVPSAGFLQRAESRFRAAGVNVTVQS
ncbi:MAG: glycyl-radical enzyme activating protein [Clostridiales Family XIII bacterium]|jgi:pyruvate formate lyase activating enzyme|nr:glycyl-radical enzyme activating protein [Clostridiales Family XIII bacterium]